MPDQGGCGLARRASKQFRPLHRVPGRSAKAVLLNPPRDLPCRVRAVLVFDDEARFLGAAALVRFLGGSGLLVTKDATDGRCTRVRSGLLEQGRRQPQRPPAFETSRQDICYPRQPPRLGQERRWPSTQGAYDLGGLGSRHAQRLVRLPRAAAASGRGQLLESVRLLRFPRLSGRAVLLQAEGSPKRHRRIRVRSQLLAASGMARVGVLWRGERGAESR